MLERKVPYRERLELCISGLDVPLVLMVELAQTYIILCRMAAYLSRFGIDIERKCGKSRILVI